MDLYKSMDERWDFPLNRLFELTLFTMKLALLSALQLWLVAFQVSATGHVPVTVTVKGVTAVAETDDNFVCATLDWWPPDKCNYNQCPWGKASVLNLVSLALVFLSAVLVFSFSVFR